MAAEGKSTRNQVDVSFRCREDKYAVRGSSFHSLFKREEERSYIIPETHTSLGRPLLAAHHVAHDFNATDLGDNASSPVDAPIAETNLHQPNIHERLPSQSDVWRPLAKIILSNPLSRLVSGR